jgi:hypothetical protein
MSGENTSGRDNGRKRPRGYAAWRPRAKTLALLDTVATVLDEYDEYLPLSVRQVFYRLVATAAYPKTEDAYGRLCEVLTRARRAGLIAFDAVRDDGVTTSSHGWYGSPADFWDDAVQRARSYSRDRQQGQPQRVELWCEAAGMLPQLGALAARYSVPAYSAGGFLSLTAVRQIVDRAVRRDVPTVLLHVGDYDPSGVAVFRALAEDAAAFVESDRLIGTQRIEAVRVALTEEQVEDYGLETAPPKRSDSRTRSWVGETCQLEALAPDQLAEIVTEAIDARFDLDHLTTTLLRERADRVELLRALPAAGGTSV